MILAKHVVVVLFLAALDFSFVSGGAAPDEHVVTLTNANFETFIKENKMVLVEFYAPWCGHCQQMAPEYENAAKQLKESVGVPLAKVDAIKEDVLAHKYEVSGFPTLKLFRYGKPEKYKGGRTAATIVQWIESISGPVVEIVSDKDAAEKVVKDQQTAYVGAFSSQNSAAYKIFQAAAEKNRAFGKFIAFIDPSANGEVSVYHKDEEVSQPHTISDSEDFETFCNSERFPLLGAMNGDNYDDYFESGRRIIWFAGSNEDFTSQGKVIRDVAKEFRIAESFVWLDTGNFESYAQRSLGVTEFPALVVGNEQRFVYPHKSFDSSSVIQWLHDIASGKVERHLMSQPIPETNDEPVKVVVGKTFSDMVLQPEKDVLLEIYAPWCGHCKKFEPIYTRFAKKMVVNKHLISAKMDGTVNESPLSQFKWKGFPTVLFVKAGSDEPIEHLGDRTFDGLMTFVEAHSTQPLIKVDDSSTDEL